MEIEVYALKHFGIAHSGTEKNHYHEECHGNGGCSCEFQADAVFPVVCFSFENTYVFLKHKCAGDGSQDIGIYGEISEAAETAVYHITLVQTTKKMNEGIDDKDNGENITYTGEDVFLFG